MRDFFCISQRRSTNFGVKRVAAQAGLAHCLARGDLSAPPEREDGLPVFRQRRGRPAKVLAAGFRRVDALALALADGQALLLGDRAQHFDQDIVHHVKYPFLPLGQFHHRGRQVNHLEADAVLLKPLQFGADVGFAAAEPVEGFDNQRIAGAQNRGFQRLIAGAVQVFAGLFVRDDVAVVRAERTECFQLAVKVLPAG